MNERKFDLIQNNIESVKTVAEVNQQSLNIQKLNDSYLPRSKEKTKLVRIQEKRLNEFLNEEQRKVYNLVLQKQSLFFTGSAGTGKSFLTQSIIRSLEIK